MNYLSRIWSPYLEFSPHKIFIRKELYETALSVTSRSLSDELDNQTFYKQAKLEEGLLKIPETQTGKTINITFLVWANNNPFIILAQMF